MVFDDMSVGNNKVIIWTNICDTVSIQRQSKNNKTVFIA